MLNKILSIIQFIIIISFILLINIYYFSEQNIERINKNRNNLLLQITKNLDQLPELTNDTNNVIEYQNNNEIKEKIKKRSFWNLLNKK